MTPRRDGTRQHRTHDPPAQGRPGSTPGVGTMNTNHATDTDQQRRVVTFVLYRSQPNGDVWPPPADEALIDWRLPTDPTRPSA